MKPILLLIFSVLANSAAFCADPVIPAVPSAPAKPEQAAGTIDIADLFQLWLHSGEEDKPDGKSQTFRPEAFKNFPPSRFRMKYKFDANGNCEWFFLSPTDGHEMKAGKWQLDAKDKSILQITKDGNTESFKIAALTKELLELIPIETKPGK